MNEPAVVISVRDIVNRFGTQVVHDGVSLDVMPGEVLEASARLLESIRRTERRHAS